jgi:hypothetical protein
MYNHSNPSLGGAGAQCITLFIQPSALLYREGALFKVSPLGLNCHYNSCQPDRIIDYIWSQSGLNVLIVYYSIRPLENWLSCSVPSSFVLCSGKIATRMFRIGAGVFLLVQQLGGFGHQQCSEGSEATRGPPQELEVSGLYFTPFSFGRV